MNPSKQVVQREFRNLNNILALTKIRVRSGVILRPLKTEDATRILEILAADDAIRKRVSMASQMHSPEDVVRQVELYQRDADLVRYALLKDDEVAGLVSFWRDTNSPFGTQDNPDDYGFGYFLDPAHRGKGLVTDAVRCIMDLARTVLHVRLFIANCEDDNHESIAVLTKLGFEPTDLTFREPNNGWLERKYIQGK